MSNKKTNVFIVPFTSSQINCVQGSIIPSSANLADNTLFLYYARYLFNRLISVYKFSLPSYWNKDYFLNVLYSCGYIAVIDNKEFGVIPQYNSFADFGLFYQPKDVVIENNFVSFTGEIGKDCELIKLTNDYHGLLDIIHLYAGKMALVSQAIDINLINSKVATVFHCSNQTVAEAMKKLYDSINSGEPAVFVDKKYKENGEIWETFNRNIKESFIASDLQEEMRKLEEEFYVTIGFPTFNRDKKERLTIAEVNKEDDVAKSLGDLWLENLQESIKKCIKMFPSLNGKLSVDWRYKGGVDNGENNGTGTL